MKCFKWIAFVFLIGVNISVAVYLRDYFAVAKLPLAFIALSVCCSALFVLDVKSKVWRGVTYGILIAIILLGLVYALLYRRPLGFYTAASSTVTFARWFITGRQSPIHKFVTKITWSLTVFLIVALIATILFGFWSIHTNGLLNGGSCFWSKSDEKLFNNICPASVTDEETVKATYQWVLDYLEYDEDFDTEYQYFDIHRILDCKSGLCFDYSHLFAAVCRSRNIPCYILDGYNRKDNNMRHTWNRVYFNGTWWNVDLSFDDKAEGQKYGFYKLESLTDEDKDLHITFIY